MLGFFLVPSASVANIFHLEFIRGNGLAESALQRFGKTIQAHILDAAAFFADQMHMGLEAPIVNVGIREADAANQMLACEGVQIVINRGARDRGKDLLRFLEDLLCGVMARFGTDDF